jgi:hypothetical protein
MKKNYELVTQDLTNMQVVKATFENGDGAWIPVDPNNSDYAEYLRYTAWVEAGNGPDEFWSQENDII